MRLIVGASIAAATLCGCAYNYQPPAPPVPAALIAPPFSAAEAAWAKAPGPNRLTGAAATRTQNGDAKTCAGLDVALIPQTPYTRAVFHQVFFERAVPDAAAIESVPIGDWRALSAPVLAATDPAQRDLDRHTRCDGAGNFEFDDLPDGDWFVVAAVIWIAPKPYSPGRTIEEGEMMLARVRTVAGHTARVVLSPF
jgi:hypothetical protein